MPRSEAPTNTLVRVLSKSERESFLSSLATAWMSAVEKGDVIVMTTRPNWPKSRPGALRSRRITEGRDAGHVYVWLEPEQLPLTALPEPAGATETEDEVPLPDEPAMSADDVYAAAEEAFAEMR